MKLREALDQKLIRLVPKKEESNYPQPYLHVEKWEKWQDHLGEDMVLVNIQGKFIFFGRKDLNGMHDKGRNVLANTLSFPNSHKAIAYIGDHNAETLPYKIKRNDWMKITLTKKLLDTEITNIDHLSLGTMELNHALYLIYTGKMAELTTEDLLGVLCYPDTYEVLSDEEQREVIQKVCNEINSEGLLGDLTEIKGRHTSRSRGLMNERKYWIAKPEAFNAFGSHTILKQGTVFKKHDSSND